MICMVILFAPVSWSLALLDLNPPATVGGRYGCFARSRYCVLKSLRACCSKAGASLPALQNSLTDLKIGHYTVADAATFLAPRLALRVRVLPVRAVAALPRLG